MRPETTKLLEDIRAAGLYILDKTRIKSLDDYLADDLLRPAVERNFEIIGEALVRLRRDDPGLPKLQKAVEDLISHSGSQ